jgi:hypothetical protein
MLVAALVRHHAPAELAALAGLLVLNAYDGLRLAWALGLPEARLRSGHETAPALIPLSHDHHHGLVQARRLRRAAEHGAAERRDAAAAFLQFFARDTREHFRDEEEQLFPLLAGADEPATELLTRALLEHQRLHALVNGLDGELLAGLCPRSRCGDSRASSSSTSASRSGCCSP